MSKKFSHTKHFDEYDEGDYYYENGYHDHKKEQRKLKRMKNALKSKNIEDLMHLDDDDYE